MRTFIERLAIGLLATSLLTAPALAQPDADPAQLSATAVDSPFAASATATDDALDAATAREDLSLVAESRQTANVSNNSVNGTSTTGDIRIGDEAFQGSTGLTIINANSGNNVGMNASLNVNIVMTPTTPQP